MLATELSLVLCLSTLPAGSAAATAQEPDAVLLFRKNCAACHGENGDGHGTQQLDRPARSFKDGGFSYGNTPEALYRTISSGIPGTPMPGFDTSLGEAERHALANYVTTLGPEAREVTLEETILVVGDRPAVVHGMLPPIDSGAVSHPRGLLLGTTSGLTFEYRADDVRMLGVRQGAFVERSDWGGRGGTGLEPLGKVVHLVEEGKPEPFFELAQGERRVPLFADLSATWVRGTDVGLTYRLQREEHAEALVWVTESVEAYGGAVGAGFRRRFALTDAARDTKLRVELPRVRGKRDLVLSSFFQADPNGLHPARSWTVVKRANGVVECVGTVLVGGRIGGAGGVFDLEVATGVSAALHVVTILTTSWSDEVRRGLAEVSFP